ncbi:macrophage migration inhibitory factor-like [Pecten maximus]|uniref:macrophage migration inhibitory factor-like n=1 Tax=Pecten maximus TaxID=6579 RepID=UPI0014584E19|nr:macrophage migration inhibitory factor-like [Pecten maximus]
MTITKLAVVVRTNVPKAAIQKEFLEQLSTHLAKKYNTEEQHVVLEIHGDVMMTRGGKTSPMLNMNVYHNSDMITQATKHADAGSIAKFVNDAVSIPVDRILVLFFDTRKCT